MRSFEELKKCSEQFFEKCTELTSSHPWLVCLAMHEYARNLYPSDPYISFSSKNPTERLFKITNNLITFLKSGNQIGSYKESFEVKSKSKEVKKATGEIYGKLWDKFSIRQLSEKAYDILKERFEKNNISTALIVDKSVVDVGCGSGRFSIALKKFGAGSVTGVDYGEPGLEVARKASKELAINGVVFQKGNILDLPFGNEMFDFTFSNGVIHHSESLEKGLDELFRITKLGGHIWLYIYGAGGIFWYARKRMPEIMKMIPQDYTIKILDCIGMPSDRFIFTDNWYVPIERHTSLEEILSLFDKYNPKNVKRLQHGRDTDLEYHSLFGGEEGKIMYGDGELRFIITK